jgi:uncharacterized membrane protein
VAHGFVRNPNGTFIAPIDAPGAAIGFVGTSANSINPAGAITGSYYDANGMAHGFVRNPNGTFIAPIDAPSAQANTFPSSINQLGAITGYYFDANGEHGFLWTP